MCWIAGAKVEAQDGSSGLLGGCLAGVAAFRNMAAWVIAEGSLALNEILLPAVSTWKRFRQSPSDHRRPTMSGPISGLLDCKVESTRVGNGVVENEGEGPE